MAGDIHALFTLDDSSVLTGLKRVERRARETSSAIDKDFRGSGSIVDGIDPAAGRDIFSTLTYGADRYSGQIREGSFLTDRLARKLNAEMQPAVGRVGKAFEKAGRDLFGFNNIARAGMAGVAGTIALAAKIVRDYASEWDIGRQKIEETERAANKFMLSLGRDFAALLSTIDASGPYKKLDEIRNVVVNSISDVLAPGNAAAVDQTLEQQRRQQKELENARAISDFRKKLRIEELRESGDTIGAARLERELYIQNQRKQLAEMGLTSGQDYYAAREDINRRGDAIVAKAVREREEKRKADYEAARREDEMNDSRLHAEQRQEQADAVRRRESEWRYYFEQRALDIETQRLRGEREAADIAEERLRFERLIYDVQRDASIDEQVRATTIENLNMSLADRLALMETTGRGVQGARSLEAGVSGAAGLSRLVFSASSIERQQLAVEKSQEQILRQIENNTRNPVAVFG